MPLQHHLGPSILSTPNCEIGEHLVQYLTSLRAENEALHEQVGVLTARLNQALDARDDGGKRATQDERMQRYALSLTPPLSSVVSISPPPGLELEIPIATAHETDEPLRQHSRASTEGEPDPEPARARGVSSEAVASEEGGCSEQSTALKVVVALLPGGIACTRVEWRLEHVRAKLRASCGFPLVSPSFSVAGMPPLRLMFVPGDRWASSSKCGNKQQRKRGGQLQTGGSACGMLKLKAGNVEGGAVVTFYFTLGATRLGPLKCDFGERIVQGCDLTEDWSTHVKPEGDQLCLGVDILA